MEEGYTGNIKEATRVGREKHPRKLDKFIQYGTAGFRTKGCDLDHVIYRMGLLAVLRSKVKQAAIGVMITASHNPEEDNGVKLVDPLGEMLEVAWESHATKLANARDEDLGKCLEDVVKMVGLQDASIPAKVIYGRDTRPSSVSLSAALRDGIEAAGGEACDFGLLTTPQLHYMVCCTNTGGRYGEPTEDGYYIKLSKAFKKLRNTPSSGNYIPHVTVDTANGVGGPKLTKLIPQIGDLLNIDMNNNGEGVLNYKCGADFVKVQQNGPEGINLEPGKRYVSFDGDADRVVYYFIEEGGRFRLMDGDKIATLVAGYLMELVRLGGLHLELGIVQTAYSNGSSTHYIQHSLKVPVACVPTGVKHLHHKALDYDIGVYFEANGHGTVIFSKKAEEAIKAAASEAGAGDAQRAAIEKLQALVDLINQTVGDAISDMLLVETVLHAKDWSVGDWNKAYSDLPNRQLKVKVADRTVIKTTDAERRTTTPPGLQEAVDKLVTKYTSGRSFVRPSGTEDVVRVYSEADTQENADKLGHEVSIAVFDLAGGVGDRP